jgi:methylglutaconyl-CoA hydratase
VSGGSGVVLVRVEGGVGWLTLNRPQKRNALNAALVRALSEALRQAEDDPAVRVVALEGAGKDFCAGADLAAVEQLARGPVAENLADAQALGDLFVRMRRMRKPVVAVVRGRALAGGCGLATASDLVVAAASARFGYPEISVGFVPAMVMAILRRNVGEKRAFELVALGETVGAQEAARLGLVNRIYADADLEVNARQFLDELAGRSATALQISKRLLYEQESMSFESAIRSGAEVNVIARMTDDARAGIAGFTGSGRGGE